MGKPTARSITQEFLFTELAAEDFFNKTGKLSRKKDKNSSLVSTRETQVMNLLIKGLRTFYISRELNIRRSTISTVNTIYFKK